jgi:outer membrane protein assembly factor BamA
LKIIPQFRRPGILFTGIVCLYLAFVSSVCAQKPTEILPETEDASKATEGDSVKKYMVLPLISASPETSLRLGVTGIFFIRRKGMTPETQLTSILIPISYTLNGQFRAKIAGTYYSNENKTIINGTAQWFNYPLLFYGIGNDTQSTDEEIYTTQTLEFDISYLKSVIKNLYVGLGYRYFDSNIVKFQPGGELEQPGVHPGNTGSVISGFNLKIRYDSRDNNLCAASGFYADIKLANYEPWLGSEFDFTRLDLDLRKYFLPFGKHVIAVQLVMANVWGNPSFETTALLGGKMIMRGHYEGRFRDNSLYAVQGEYRLPIGRSNWIDNREKIPIKERFGLVGFIGVGDVASSFGNIDLSKIKTSVGFGIRYLAFPKERINVRVDFGFGTQLPGLYFNIREAF